MTAVTTNHRTTKYNLLGNVQFKTLEYFSVVMHWAWYISKITSVLSVFRDFPPCYLLNITCIQNQCTGQGTRVRAYELSRFSRVWLSLTPWTVAHQTPLSMRFSRQEYWGGWLFLLQWIFPTQELNLLLRGLLHCGAETITFHFCPLHCFLFSL